MMDMARAVEIVGRITYRPGWEVDVHWLDPGVTTRLYLQVRFMDECSATGRVEEQRGRKWLLSEHMTESEVVQTALKAVLTAEEHEARERFKYNGRALYGPHKSVTGLARVATEVRLPPRSEPSVNKMPLIDRPDGGWDSGPCYGR